MRRLAFPVFVEEYIRPVYITNLSCGFSDNLDDNSNERELGDEIFLA